MISAPHLSVALNQANYASYDQYCIWKPTTHCRLLRHALKPMCMLISTPCTAALGNVALICKRLQTLIRTNTHRGYWTSLASTISTHGINTLGHITTTSARRVTHQCGHVTLLTGCAAAQANLRTGDDFQRMNPRSGRIIWSWRFTLELQDRDSFNLLVAIRTTSIVGHKMVMDWNAKYKWKVSKNVLHRHLVSCLLTVFLSRLASTMSEQTDMRFVLSWSHRSRRRCNRCFAYGSIILTTRIFDKIMHVLRLSDYDDKDLTWTSTATSHCGGHWLDQHNEKYIY